jgi:SNF family Na+-dependent transporter
MPRQHCAQKVPKTHNPNNMPGVAGLPFCQFARILRNLHLLDEFFLPLCLLLVQLAHLALALGLLQLYAMLLTFDYRRVAARLVNLLRGFGLAVVVR